MNGVEIPADVIQLRERVLSTYVLVNYEEWRGHVCSQSLSWIVGLPRATRIGGASTTLVR